MTAKPPSSASAYSAGSEPSSDAPHGSKGGWVLPHPEVIKADPNSCPHAVLDEGAGIAWGFEDCVTCGKRFPMRSDEGVG